MKLRPVELEQIRQARARLETLVTTYPELRSVEARDRLTTYLERMMRGQAGKQVFVRLPDDLMTEIDRYVGILAAEQPGLKPTRSDAIRILLYRGLEAEKAQRQGRQA